MFSQALKFSALERNMRQFSLQVTLNEAVKNFYGVAHLRNSNLVVSLFFLLDTFNWKVGLTKKKDAETLLLF